MKNILIVLLASVLFSPKINGLKCYTCQGFINELKNVTCSQIAENETCYIVVDYAVDKKNWLVNLTNFKEPQGPHMFPNDYIKPKSGSDFAEIVYTFYNDKETNQIINARYFCYTDYCNQLSMVHKLIASQIWYENIPMETPIETCLQCNGPTYESVKNCKIQRPCSSCNLSSNNTGDGLYSFLSWSSVCMTRSNQTSKRFQESNTFLGDVTLQYEFQTKRLYSYVDIICRFKECYTFEFMNRFSQSFEIAF
ncbi:unnamed protein product [Brachionus calyciflorus]|uniref:Uncharacterized protein n=1 Tax=Brachionus calyciflorus TaxID=104777 RepID=A0A814AAP8_9BILA|nr:unnamed protein product [Brachionus calyciflorus]